MVNYQDEINRIERKIIKYENIAKYLTNKEKELEEIDVKGFDKEINEIKKYIKDLDSLSKIDYLFNRLKDKIADYKKRYDVLQNQISEIPEYMIKKELTAIKDLMSSSTSIYLAEERIKEIRQKINDRNRICFPIELTQYTDSSLIGNGGFARVYRAKNIINNKIVAVKIPITNDAAIGKSFMRELTNWVKLKHKNIVEVFGYNVLPVPFFEMELCQTSLDKLKKPLKPNNAINYMIGISDGLKYAHSKKIVHLDLKPQNILLKQDIPKISDWGMSRLITEHGTSTIGLSLPFAAPEQYTKKFGKKDEQTDIWQMGVLFYNLLTGEIPFCGKDYSDYLENISTCNFTEIIDNKEISSEITEILYKCLEKNKKNRYKRIDNLKKDLSNITKYKKF